MWFYSLNIGLHTHEALEPLLSPEQRLLFLKITNGAGCQWLMPVVLATLETEILEEHPWRSAQAGSLQDPISTNSRVVCACHPKLCGKLRAGGSWFEVSPGKKVYPISTQKH
jgi:hypothetical protein